MAAIQKIVAQEGLDPGSEPTVRVSDALASAVEGLGSSVGHLGAVIQQRQDQKDDFAARIKEQQFGSSLEGLESNAVQNAPEDGTGLHDSVVGVVGRGGQRTPNTFDTQFNNYLAAMPASKRADFAAKRELYREQVSQRMAKAQYGAEQDYYKVEIQKGQNDLLGGLSKMDPKDDAGFESFKNAGLSLIDASRLPALEKDVARTNWNAKAAEDLFKLKLEKDPDFASQARSALGLAPPPATTTGDAASGGAVDVVTDKIIGVESGGRANAKNPNSSASGVGQFLDSTWVATVRQHRPDIAEGKSAAQIIALKGDASLGRQMTKAYTQDNADFLANRGATTTPGNLYLAHFLGPQGAVEVLKADPAAPIASVVGGDVVRANPFLQGKTVADTIAWADRKMGGAGTVDQRFDAIPFDRKVELANTADVQQRQYAQAAAAQTKADYSNYKDAIDLQIARGKITDSSVIVTDPTLNDGDKAQFVRAVNEANKGANQIAFDLSALREGSLHLDAYDTKDRTRVDNMFDAAAKALPADSQPAFVREVVKQTGVVPQPVVNDIRARLASTSPSEVILGAQAASALSAQNRNALTVRDGGDEVSKAADLFAHYRETGLSDAQAAQRMIDLKNPEKARERDALIGSKTTKDWLDSTATEKTVGDIFDPGIFSSEPALGSPAQSAAMVAEYKETLQESLVDAGGDQTAAKALADKRFASRYGTSDFNLAGNGVVTRLPPEKTYPAGADGTHAYVGRQATEALKADMHRDVSDVYLQADQQTDADARAGRPPRYQLFYKDAETGILQRYNLPFYAIPPSGAEIQQQQLDQSRAQMEQNRADEMALQQRRRDRPLYDVSPVLPPLNGGPVLPPAQPAPPPMPPVKPLSAVTGDPVGDIKAQRSQLGAQKSQLDDQIGTLKATSPVGVPGIGG